MAAPSTSFNDHTYNVISHTLKNVSAKSWGDEKVPQSPGPLTRTITPVLTRIYSNWLGVVKPEYTCRQRTMMENSSQKGLSPWRERPISCWNPAAIRQVRGAGPHPKLLENLENLDYQISIPSELEPRMVVEFCNGGDNNT